MDLNTKQLEILEIAEKLFAENGFDGTSVRSIAKAAGINIAMISYYFGSKEKLLETLFETRISGFKMQLESVISKDDDYLKKVDEIVELTIKRVHRNRMVYKIIHFEFSNENRKISNESYLNQKKENYMIIEDFVKSGQQAGVFSKKTNIQLIVPTILGTYFHFYYNNAFYLSLYGSKISLDNYVFNILTPHIQQTIKALLTYKN